MLEKLIKAVGAIDEITKGRDTYITVYSDYGDTRVSISSKLFDMLFDDYTIEKRDDEIFPYKKTSVRNGVKIYAIYSKKELKNEEI